MRHCAACRYLPRRLGNDVRRQLIFDEGNAVTQDELALLEPLDLQDVGSGQSLQRFDRDIEVAMLLPQPRKLSPQLDFFLFGHRRSIPGTLSCGVALT